jgi:hypothetical protein
MSTPFGNVGDVDFGSSHDAQFVEAGQDEWSTTETTEVENSWAAEVLTPNEKKHHLQLGDDPTQRLEGLKLAWAEARENHRLRSKSDATYVAVGAESFAAVGSGILRKMTPGKDNFALGAGVYAEPLPLSRDQFMSQVGARLSRAYARGKTGAVTAQPAVLVTTVVDESVQRRHIVTIPGTNPKGKGDVNSKRQTIHQQAAAFDDSEYVEEESRLGRSDPGALSLLAYQAMDKAGIQPWEPVLIEGHSMGGMVAGDLASRPEFFERFNVTTLVLFGSPSERFKVNESVKVVAFEHDNDPIVKYADGITRRNEGNPNYLVVRSNSNAEGLLGPHATEEYAKTAQAWARSPEGAHWMNGQSSFMTETVSEVAYPMLPAPRR